MNGLLQNEQSRIRTRNVLFLVFALPITFQTFMYFPGMSWVQEFSFALWFLYLVFAYPWSMAKPNNRPSTFEWYVIAVIVITPFLSAFDAWREYGQPLIYGLLAERSLALMAFILFLERALRKGSVTLEEVERALLILAWGTTILYAAIRIFLNPLNYVDYPVFSNGVGFILPPHFIGFAVYYYFFRGFRTGRRVDYLLAIFLFSVSLGKSGFRQTIVLTAVTFTFLIYRWSTRRQFVVLIPKLLLGMGFLAALFYYVSPASAADVAGRFQDAFTVVLTGAPGEDVSANARIGEAAVAMEAIAKHPLLGNGQLSNQWQGGRLSVLGAYFYWVDIGTLGAVYFIGVLGVALYAIQFFFIWRAMKGSRGRLRTSLSDATEGIVTSMIFGCLFGGFVTEPTLCLFFILLLRSIARTKTGDGIVLGLAR